MRPFCAPLPLTGAVDQYRLEMTGQMERSHAHGHKPMLPGIDCQYENVKRGYRMKVIDMHCDTISELHKDHLKGGSASIPVSYTHLGRGGNPDWLRCNHPGGDGRGDIGNAHAGSRHHILQRVGGDWAAVRLYAC